MLFAESSSQLVVGCWGIFRRRVRVVNRMLANVFDNLCSALKHKHQLGRMVRAVANANAARFAVCFVALVKVIANCAVLTLAKLKKLSLN